MNGKNERMKIKNKAREEENFFVTSTSLSKTTTWSLTHPIVYNDTYTQTAQVNKSLPE